MSLAPFTKPSAWSAIPAMTPGAGWGGSTATPANEGAASDAFAAATAIARWTSVPYGNAYQTTPAMTFGVLAFHGDQRGYPGCWVKKVEMACEGGSWVTATWGVNPDTGTTEYRASIDPSGLAAGVYEIRARIYPFSGACRVLSGMTFRRWANGTTRSVAYVNPSTGNDSTGSLNSTGSKYATIFKAAKALASADATYKGDGCTVYLDAGDHKWMRTEYGSDPECVASWLTIRPSPGESKATVNVVPRAGSGVDASMYFTHARLLDVTIKASITTSSATTDRLWLDSCAVQGTGTNDTVPGISASDWTEKYVTDCTYDDVSQGPILCTLVRSVTCDTLGNDVFTGSGCVSHCTVSNLTPYGSNHMDLWQESSAGTTSNIVIYRNKAKTACACEGIFMRANTAFADMAIVDNDWLLSAYPQQSQMLCTITHCVVWNNTHLGAPLTFGFSDSTLTEPLASANALFSVKGNVFQWVQGTDPESYLGQPVSTSDFSAMGSWADNHYCNVFYSDSSAVSSAMTIGSGTSTGTTVSAGRGCTWSPVGQVHA